MSETICPAVSTWNAASPQQHPAATHRWGVTPEAIKEVILSGKLPLLELEAEGVAQLKARNIDSLAIFLHPGAVEQYQERLTAWLRESEEEIAARQRAAADEMEAARGHYESLGFEEVPPYYYNPIPGAHYLKADLDAPATRW